MKGKLKGRGVSKENEKIAKKKRILYLNINPYPSDKAWMASAGLSFFLLK